MLAAVEEVENAITAFDLNQVRVQYLQAATSATQEAVELVLVQYNTGLTDFNNVLVTQRDLFSSRINWRPPRPRLLQPDRPVQGAGWWLGSERHAGLFWQREAAAGKPFLNPVDDNNRRYGQTY